jgi:hypothetical protein
MEKLIRIVTTMASPSWNPWKSITTGLGFTRKTSWRTKFTGIRRLLCLEKEFEYMLEKVESADKSYGMISISSENKGILKKIFTEAK